MAYSKEEAADLVLSACKKLVDEKLIARTWGNVSARLSDTQFLITPSGLAYSDLSSDDLVVVNIADCSYSGNIKPSSEKGIHASAYALRKEINFVIHTHQDYASSISVLGIDFDFAPCAAYGLPGTNSLKTKVTACLKQNSDAKAFLLQRHGTLCLGETFEDSFEVARTLEAYSKAWYLENKVDVSSSKLKKVFLDDYAQIMGPFAKPMEGEDQSAVDLISNKNRLAATCSKYAKPMCFFDVLLQNYVYKTKYSKLKDSKK